MMPVAADDAGFASRHLGPDAEAIAAMLAEIGAASLDDLIAATIPGDIRAEIAPEAAASGLPLPLDEAGVLAELAALASRNGGRKPLIGQGYHGTFLPPVIQRNVLENPAWYTAYTPYQPEISQGRLEALLAFQTMITDLTGMEIANASLLDEATAAAEAVAMAHAVAQAKDATTIAVAADLHPQTRAVLATRAAPHGWTLVEFAPGDAAAIAAARPFAVMLQYPGTTGALRDLGPEIAAARAAGALAIVAADPLALVLLTPPGEMGADVVVGSAQRFGVAMGFGGPHAGFFATRAAFRRHMPGRLVGVSIDAEGRPALRLALQTREQHIRREKATSNICTNQGLMALAASVYLAAVGLDGLRGVAEASTVNAHVVYDAVTKLKGYAPLCPGGAFFHEFAVRTPKPAAEIVHRAAQAGVLAGVALDRFASPMEDANALLIAVTEKRTADEVDRLVEALKKA